MDPMNTRLWKLPDDIAWMGAAKIYYNRECYDDMIDKSDSRKLILVTGTSGIGKSSFIQRFLVHLVDLAAEEGKCVPSIHYKCGTNAGLYPRSQTFSLLANGKVIEVDGSVQTPPDYLLADSVDIIVPYGLTLNMQVASDNVEDHKQFQKRMDEYDGQASEVETIIMPLFTFQELLCIKRPTFDFNVAQYRYDLYGGSPRNFNSVGSFPSGLKIIEYVRAEMDMFFGDSVAKIYPDEWESNIRRIAHTLDVRYGDKASALNMIHSMMTHKNGHETIWASQFMGFLAAAVLQSNNNITISDEIRELFNNSTGVGFLFKAMGHRKHFHSDKFYLLKPLLKSMPLSQPEFPLILFTYPVSLIRTIEDIRNIPKKYYGLPAHRDFPFVDAIIQPNTLIKFVISPEVHIDKGHSIESIRDQLTGNRASHQIIFVVPISCRDTFLHQDHNCLGDILQFMCFDDFSTSPTSLMSSNERDSWISVDVDEDGDEDENGDEDGGENEDGDENEDENEDGNEDGDENEDEDEDEHEHFVKKSRCMTGI